MATRTEELEPQAAAAQLGLRLRTVLEELEREVRGGLSVLLVTREGHILARMVRGNVDPRALATAGAFLLAGGDRLVARFTHEGLKTIAVEGIDGALIVVEPVSLAFEDLALVVLVPSRVNRVTLRMALDRAVEALRKLEPARRGHA